VEWIWDEAKNRQNVRKHGVPFELALEMFFGAVFEFVDAREDYGEIKFVAIGMVQGRFFVCVYAMRGRTRQVISLRKATSRERERYVKEILG
jgi:hypothetical protein